MNLKYIKVTKCDTWQDIVFWLWLDDFFWFNMDDGDNFNAKYITVDIDSGRYDIYNRDIQDDVLISFDEFKNLWSELKCK